MKVAYQGEPGAYSELAVLSAFPDANASPLKLIRHVFKAVDAGEADFGVVPLENSQAGSINETYDLLLHEDGVGIVGEVIVPVDHALLGRPGQKLEDVRWVFSHPQALAQCDEFLSELGVDRVPVFDTAGAARRLAEEGEADDAAIASVRAAQLNGLVVLAERIQTHKENFTNVAGLRGQAPTGIAVRVHQAVCRPGREPHQARVPTPTRRGVRLRVLHGHRNRHGPGPRGDPEGDG
jgi:prephenate dehydratase